MRIVLEVRGRRGQLFDARDEPLGPDFPEFRTPHAGHAQIDRLWGCVGLIEFDDLHDELNERWGRPLASQWVRDRTGALLDQIAEHPICQAAGVIAFFAQVAWHELRAKRA